MRQGKSPTGKLPKKINSVDGCEKPALAREYHGESAYLIFPNLKSQYAKENSNG